MAPELRAVPHVLITFAFLCIVVCVLFVEGVMFAETYHGQRRVIQSEAWLYDQCQSPAFVSRLAGHHTICADVERNAHTGALFYALGVLGERVRALQLALYASWATIVGVCCVVVVVDVTLSRVLGHFSVPQHTRARKQEQAHIAYYLAPGYSTAHRAGFFSRQTV
jgi:hypothetical protein